MEKEKQNKAALLLQEMAVAKAKDGGVQWEKVKAMAHDLKIVKKLCVGLGSVPVAVLDNSFRHVDPSLMANILYWYNLEIVDQSRIKKQVILK